MAEDVSNVTSSASSSSTSSTSDAMTAAQNWWILLLQGLVAILVGWLLLVNPAKTTLALVVILGLYWLISGIVEIIMSFFDIGKKDSHWGLKLLGGIVSLIAGLFIVNNPVFAGVVTPLMLMYVVAFLFIFNGLIRMFAGKQNFDTMKYDWTWGDFFLGALYLITGIWLLASPLLVSVATVIFTVALLQLVGGVVLVVLSFKVKGSATTQNS